MIKKINLQLGCLSHVCSTNLVDYAGMTNKSQLKITI
jgi:hypothetical protein